MPYFNHELHTADNWWGRREFLAQWWRLYEEDGRFTPPPWSTLAWATNPARNPHLARLSPTFLHLTALPRRGNSYEFLDPQHWLATSGVFEVPTGTAVLLSDPRRQDETVYLALNHLLNDETSQDVFLDHLSERLSMAGQQRLLGPVGLSPHLGSGVLQDAWSVYPPLHTPYNPPYLPHLLERSGGEPLETVRLYHLPVTAVPPSPDAPAQLTPLPPGRLATDCFPLLAAATNSPHFPAADALEAAFLLRWLNPATLTGWLAQVQGEPVGFVLLQPDLAPLLRRARGGRKWWWRWWLAARQKRPMENGRLLFLAVLPPWRGQGIGRQLLQQTLHIAHQFRWHHITIGPLADGDSAVSLLQPFHAQPHQTYTLYQWFTSLG